jgi:hypothetical protein
MILCRLPERINEIWPTLEQSFLREKDEVFQAHFLRSLSSLASGDLDTSIPWFEKVRQVHPSKLVRIVAAIHLPLFAKHKSSEALVIELIHLLKTEPEEFLSQYMAYHGGTNLTCYDYDLTLALSFCEPALRKQALPILLQQFHTHKDIHSHGSLTMLTAKTLLDIVFPLTNNKTPITSFNVEQQHIIAALCNADKIWGKWLWDTYLREHGLPDTREALLAMIR